MSGEILWCQKLHKERKYISLDRKKCQKRKKAPVWFKILIELLPKASLCQEICSYARKSQAKGPVKRIIQGSDVIDSFILQESGGLWSGIFLPVIICIFCICHLSLCFGLLLFEIYPSLSISFPSFSHHLCPFNGCCWLQIFMKQFWVDVFNFLWTYYISILYPCVQFYAPSLRAKCF